MFALCGKLQAGVLTQTGDEQAIDFFVDHMQFIQKPEAAMIIQVKGWCKNAPPVQKCAGGTSKSLILSDFLSSSRGGDISPAVKFTPQPLLREFICPDRPARPKRRFQGRFLARDRMVEKSPNSRRD
jgi:hypothetical protein